MNLLFHITSMHYHVYITMQFNICNSIDMAIKAN